MQIVTEEQHIVKLNKCMASDNDILVDAVKVMDQWMHSDIFEEDNEILAGTINAVDNNIELMNKVYHVDGRITMPFVAYISKKDLEIAVLVPVKTKKDSDYIVPKSIQILDNSRVQVTILKLNK